MTILPKPGMARRRRKKKITISPLPKSTLIAAAVAISVTAALAFGLPNGLPSTSSNDVQSNDYIEVTLPLPEQISNLERKTTTATAEATQAISLELPKQATDTSNQAIRENAVEPAQAVEQPKRQPLTSLRDEPEDFWRSTEIQPGDNMTVVFSRLGLQPESLYSLLNDVKEAKGLEKVLPGQTLKVRIDHTGELMELVHETDSLNGMRIFRDGDIFRAAKFKHDIEKRTEFATGTVSSSLYQAAKTHSLSDRLIVQFGNIFGWKVDFSHDVSPGATFTMIYEEDYVSGEKIGDGDILAAEFSNRGKTYRAIGLRDNKGRMKYYTPEGKTLKQAFMRNPVDFTRISSRFNPNRWHPIRGKRIPHRGVDYAAPTGTPIKASGDGRIHFVGRKGGYGKTIILDHGRGYTTLYAHLSGYKKGMKKGRAVSQGDIIGYVGATGLATGPHLHYEFRINGKHKNPMTVNLPAKDIDPRHRAKFQQQVTAMTSQLDLYKRGLVAER